MFQGYNDYFYKSESHKEKYHRYSENRQNLHPIFFWGSIFKYVSWHNHSVILDLSPICEPLVHNFKLPLEALENILDFIISKERRRYSNFRNGKSHMLKKIQGTYLNPLCIWERNYTFLDIIYHTINEKWKTRLNDQIFLNSNLRVSHFGLFFLREYIIKIHMNVPQLSLFLNYFICSY